MSKLMPPINFQKWIEENRDALKPPVGNKKIWEDTDFMAFVVGGPNQRKDYHIDPSEEFFYQIEGDLTLKLVVDGEFKDVTVREGEIFLLPSMVPHSPQRGANTVGLVIEHKRPEGENDGLRWYCESCGEVLHEQFFYLTDIVGQLKAAIEAFWASDELRTCDNCGAKMER
ncbi:3-hydroxyanthranilate 3,4-dioxygenase [Lujinxingia vulgaris]|uniref:3-hydroxyanthranilate 3,4-dioxygenase n=1 Tax=Lujinxingia vulgaris TaxID=2600176 RepID=A0A5C6XF98_9DELT|nr:3-hydroxyanthranilate 3,4-dioxygenase [Lujinxingia vulgaris]TXD35815.1 3-hydroxyanthranilate 3,4-dioxygenase [Lujinxingia vulgaris]